MQYQSRCNGRADAVMWGSGWSSRLWHMSACVVCDVVRLLPAECTLPVSTHDGAWCACCAVISSHCVQQPPQASCMHPCEPGEHGLLQELVRARFTCGLTILPSSHCFLASSAMLNAAMNASSSHEPSLTRSMYWVMASSSFCRALQGGTHNTQHHYLYTFCQQNFTKGSLCIQHLFYPNQPTTECIQAKWLV